MIKNEKTLNHFKPKKIKKVEVVNLALSMVKQKHCFAKKNILIPDIEAFNKKILPKRKPIYGEELSCKEKLFRAQMLEHLGDDWQKNYKICDDFILARATKSEHLIHNVYDYKMPMAFFYRIINDIRQDYVELSKSCAKQESISNDVKKQITFNNEELKENIVNLQQQNQELINSKNWADKRAEEFKNMITRLEQKNKKLSEEYEKNYVAYQKLLSEYNLGRDQYQTSLRINQSLVDKIKKLKTITSGIINEFTDNV